MESKLGSILHPDQTLLLGFSGGLDSRVLLQLLANLQPKLKFKLKALHVHHGLSAHADAWAKFCTEICGVLNVPIQVIKVNVARDSGLGIEASARSARYTALLKETADYVVLAHHQDDQAETLLLQLLRGAGVKGLSAMAEQDTNKRLLRPLLGVSREELETYARQQGLQWIEDESNADISYDRNFCRHQVFPFIEQRFPAAKQTLARSASHMAEAAQLLDELAALDMMFGALDTNGRQISECNCLPVENLVRLTEPRARNLLRWWLTQNCQPLPSTIRLQEMLRQLLGAKADATLKLAINSAEGVWLRRYQGYVYLELGHENQPFALVWQGEAELRLPDHSRLIFTRQIGKGLAFQRLGLHKLRISQRMGGERFKPDLAKPTRTLKHLLQEAKIPPWQRQRLPLIHADDTLALVPGIGVACNLQAREDELGLDVIWVQA